MTEVVIDNDAGRKRRLPGWMLGVCTADKQTKSGIDDESCLLLGEPPKRQDESKIEPVTRKRDRIQNEIDAGERRESLHINETKQRSRKSSRRNKRPGSSMVTFGETDTLKKKLKKDDASRGEIIGARGASKKQNLKRNGPKNYQQEVASPGSSEDEIELTVEDLISIAEEYVNADKEQQCERSVRKNGSETHRPSSIPSKFDLVRPIETTGGPSLGPVCSRFEPPSCGGSGAVKSSLHIVDTESEEKDIPASETFSSSITRSGDAAQDMLDLFLGPLLRKTPCEDQDVRTFATEGIPLDYELNTQASSGTTFKGGPPLSKKKSSLKDKVAMFLD